MSLGAVVATEAATALLILATLFTSLTPTLILLPLLGIVLNGTLSVLYNTLPELSASDTGRAFAIFYTSVIGSGGIAPIFYGLIADHSSRTAGVLASAAATAALIIPLVLTLRPHLRADAARRMTRIFEWTGQTGTMSPYAVQSRLNPKSYERFDTWIMFLKRRSF